MHACSILGGLAAALVALASPADRQDPEPDERNVEEVLDELIERAGEIESYHAVYRVDPEGEEEGAVEMYLGWPDRGRLSTTGIGEGDVDARLVDGVLLLRGDGEEVVFDYRPALESCAAVLDAISEEFPSAYERESSAGVRLGLFGYGREEPLHLTLSMVTTRSFQLPWLKEMKQHLDTLELQEDAIVCHVAETCTVWVSAESAFPERLEGERDGEPVVLLLSELEVDADLADDVFELPESDRDVEYEARQRQIQASMLLAVRPLVYAGLCGALEADERGRDEERVRRVLQTYYEELLPSAHGPWLEKTRQWIEGVGAWVAKRGEEGSEETEKGIQDAASKLRDALAAGAAKYQALELPELPDDVPTTYLDDLLALEIEVAATAYEQRIADPLLDDFDAVMEANRAY